MESILNHAICLLMQLLLDALNDEPRAVGSSSGHSWSNRFCAKEAQGQLFASFDECGNPFDSDGDVGSSSTTGSGADVSTLLKESCHETKHLREMLWSYIGSNNLGVSAIVPKCVPHGVLRWIARLLQIIQRLPSLAEDACTVFSNIFDLYATTVFRLSAGSASHERILLGIDPPRKYCFLDIAVHAQGASSPPLFGFRGRSRSIPSKSTRPSPPLSPHLDAELCAPLPSEMDDLAPLRDLIVKGQDSLQSMVKLDLVDQWIIDPVPNPSDSQAEFACQTTRVLEKRQVAAWSTLFVAIALHLSIVITKRNLKHATGDTAPLNSLESYVSSFLRASPMLVSISNRISCIRAIRGKHVVQEVCVPVECYMRYFYHVAECY
jgi:hypothetical protein